MKPTTALAIAIALAVSPFAHSFQLSPSGTAAERYIAKNNSSWYVRFTSESAVYGVHNFTHPVHEEITNLIYGCDISAAACAGPDIDFVVSPVQAGVRWNDDPPFRLATTGFAECRSDQTIRVVTQPICWYNLFRHAEKRATTTYFDGNSKRWNTMFRSHFGDLQFLHAMASRDGEKAGVTRDRILMWAEFVWSVALGDVKPETLLNTVKINRFSTFFSRSGQTVSDLFTLGNPALRRSVRDVAFGSLLHTIEDSFAFGHTDREDPTATTQCSGTSNAHPGKIRSFRSYSNQDHDKHGNLDSRESLQRVLSKRPNVVDVGKILLSMYDERVPWAEARQYLSCVFDLVNEDEPASPGEGLAKQP